jgi:hypothetical protein
VQLDHRHHQQDHIATDVYIDDIVVGRGRGEREREEEEEDGLI